MGAILPEPSTPVTGKMDKDDPSVDRSSCLLKVRSQEQHPRAHPESEKCPCSGFVQLWGAPSMSPKARWLIVPSLYPTPPTTAPSL